MKLPPTIRAIFFFAMTGFALIFAVGCGSSQGQVFTATSIPNVSPDTGLRPIARDDTYNSLGNATLVVPIEDGIFTNDQVNDALFTETVVRGPEDGVLELKSDGSFRYTPLVGFKGTERFVYTLENEAGSSSATVEFTSTGIGRFVDNTADDGGSGTQADPFNTLASAGAVAQQGDTIFVATGDGTDSGMTGGLTLPAGVNLIGQGAGLVLSQTIEPVGPAPKIEGPIICLGDNVVSGMTLDGSVSALLVIDGVGNITISDNTLSNPANEHIVCTNVSGNLTIAENTFQLPPDNDSDFIFIDNEDKDFTAAITDNLFTNEMNSNFDAFWEVETAVLAESPTVNIDFSRNIGIDSEEDQITYGFYWDNEGKNPDANLTCNDNELSNLGGYPIGAFGMSGTINGNTISNTHDYSLYCSVENDSLTVSGNVISDGRFEGINAYFEDDTGGPVPSGTLIIDNNSVDNVDSYGIFVEDNTENNGLLAIRGNRIGDTDGESSIRVLWDSDVDLCAVISSNVMDHDLELEDDDGTGDLRVEQFDIIETLNTIGGVLRATNITEVDAGNCSIP